MMILIGKITVSVVLGALGTLVLFLANDMLLKALGVRIWYKTRIEVYSSIFVVMMIIIAFLVYGLVSNVFDALFQVQPYPFQ